MPKLELHPKDIIGDWRIEKQLGAGGQAQVWAARYTKDAHSAPAAVKICMDAGPKARARFEQEIALLKKHRHEGIVSVRDNGVHENLPFFVMERASTTLGDVAAAQTTGTRLIGESRELLLRLVRQTCAAVAYLHGKSVVHRDIKPSNVLLMLDPPEPMRAVVSDLGIASDVHSQGRLTATHETIGTPSFRAPEALVGKHSTQSDVYSLGKTIECVLNRTMAPGIGPGRCLRDTVLTDDLWDRLDAILERACAFDPSARFGTAVELLHALPVPVIGHAKAGYSSIQSSSVAASLSVAERVTLSEIIGGCPASTSTIAVHALRHQSRLVDYRLSLALRRLEMLKFVEAVTETDNHGDEYAAVRPSVSGFSWAHDHQEEMDAAIDDVARKQSMDGIRF